MYLCSRINRYEDSICGKRSRGWAVNYPIGCTYIRDIDYGNRKAEYGVFLGEDDVRGNGIGKEILNLTVDYAFNELKLHRIYARVRTDNEPSLFSFLHCGFEKEALLREAVLCDGEYVDVVILGRLNPND